MRTSVLFTLVSAMCGLLLLSGTARAQSGRPEFVQNEVLVKFKPTQRVLAIAEQLPRLNAVIRNHISALAIDVLRSESLSTQQLLERLRGHPAVEYAEPNYFSYPLYTPNDPSFSQQWALSKIQAPRAWDITRGNDTVVSVLDTGVQADHPDLQGRLLPGTSIVPGYSTPVDTCQGTFWDYTGHGTHVAGTVAAATDNGIGVASIGFNADSGARRAGFRNHPGQHSEMKPVTIPG